jgi:hypothetical protein
MSTFPRNGRAHYREIEGITERLCNACGIWKPHDLTAYHANRANPTGLQTRCKTCQTADCATRQAAKRAAKHGPPAKPHTSRHWKKPRNRPKIEPSAF